MRLLPLMLLVVCCSASAEWVLMSRSDDGSIEVFIDPNSVKSSGIYRRVWVLLNLKKIGEFGERSTLAYEEHDCIESRNRTLSLSFYSGSMGDGKVLHSLEASGKWSFIRPSTLSSFHHNWLCK